MTLPPLQIGTRLANRYEILRVLGQGGFGIVYLAKDNTSQLVAIKQNTQLDPDSRAQFEREADLLRRLQHANLVRVQDYFQDSAGSQFLVMDYIPGNDLLEMAEKRASPFPEKEVLQWGIQLCDALGYMHTRTPPIIHRDLKPQNIKLEPNGRLVLVDFGIAKEMRPGQKTQRGARGATAGFSPIEQYGTIPGGTNAYTDVYALGATLYYLLTLHMPEAAPERMLNQTQLDVRRYNSSLCQLTADALLKATQLLPNERYASAVDLKKDLERALAAAQPGILCQRCGYTNRLQAHFCQSCGNSLSMRPSLPRVKCPHCGKDNRDTARMCMRCGQPLVMSPRAPLPPVQPQLSPSPMYPNVPAPKLPRGVSLAQNQAIAGWALCAMGAWGLALAFFQIWQGWILFFPYALIGLSIFSLLAGRDLGDLFGTLKHNAPDWLAFAFDTPNRGRQWGTLAAVLWIIIGIATAWLVFPLAITAGMVYILRILIDDQFMRHLGGRVVRPGWVTIIGWLLIFSGIGTVPGIALLIPKRWAAAWAQRALGAIALVAIFSLIIALFNVSALNLPAPLSYVLPGTSVHPILLATATLALATLVGAIGAIQYLETVQLNFTQTAVRRELNVTAWTLLALGSLTLISSLWEMSQAVMGAWAWVGLLAGLLAISGARDLLELGANIFSFNPPWIGDMELGRRKGVIASVLAAILAVLFAWQIYPLVLLALAMFVVRELVSAQSLLVCGGQAIAPDGIDLIAWLMIPTGIGTLPGILLLNRDARGWHSARWVLASLGIAGLIGALWATINLITNPNPSPSLAMLATSGIGLASGTGWALNYLHTTVVRRYFGV